MAEIIPPLNKDVLAKMTAGEKRFAERLKTHLEDDYTVWYDIPLGKTRRYPDFIILHPARGLLFLEVKDWRLENLRHINKTQMKLQQATGLKTYSHPLEQARACAVSVVNLLQGDKLLQEACEKYRGKLAMPWGYGVVFTHITRKALADKMPEADRELLLPDHQVIYQDEMVPSVDPEDFQAQLWGMFNYRFGKQLSLPQIDRIRAYLFPEIIIEPSQQPLFPPAHADEEIALEIPDIVKVLDKQQEKLAKGLGLGHRVIHGVAGSGKTLILGYRAEYLAQLVNKPVLILCFNVSLATKLRFVIEHKGLAGQVQVYHFHAWCIAQLKAYSVDVPAGREPIWERQVSAVIAAVDAGRIPRAQYGALLIDEGHDFEAGWLKLIVQMVDPDHNALLLLYDDAQSIYQKKSGLDFTLSSVGIQAKGRTTILKLNYRNTQEILEFAYRFAEQHLSEHSSDDDHVPLIAPESGGVNGPMPQVISLSHWQNELDHIVNTLVAWHQQGMPWQDMAVIYVAKSQGKDIAERLNQRGIPHLWMHNKSNKSAYNPALDKVTLLTTHSSKGLEFPSVILAGVGLLNSNDPAADTRLVYVGMTRAQHHLTVLASGKGALANRLRALS